MPVKRGGADRRAASMSAASSVDTSIASRRRSQLLQRQVLPSVDTIYPIFHQLELDLDWKLSALNFVIETAHVMALMVNTKFDLYPIGHGFLMQIFGSTLVPFFDMTWFGHSEIASNVLLWTFIAVVTLMCLIFVVFALRNFKVMPTYLRWTIKVLFHAITTFCLAPLTINFASYMACDATNTNMLWYPTHACWSSYHILYMTFGILGIVQLAGLLYINAGFIYADMPDAHDMTARPYSVVVLSMQLCKFILFFVSPLLISLDKPAAVGVFIAVVCGFHCGLHIFMLPYYSLRTNQIRVGQQAMLTAMAIVSAALCTVSPSNVWRTRNGGILLLCLLPVTFGAGWLATYWRVNRRLLDAIERLASGPGSNTAHYLDPAYPRHLPLHDLTYTRYPAIEKVLMGEAYFTMLNLQEKQQQQQQEQQLTRAAVAGGRVPREVRVDENGPDIAPRDEDEDDGTHNVFNDMSVLEPYVTAVYISHDVPLATRFLREYARQTATTTMTTPRMCAYAARIFTKGMARYPSSTMLVYEFCKFLAVYAGRERMSLAELSRLRARGTYIPQTLSYRIHRLSERLRNDLHVANSDQIRLTSISSKLHKETLSAMHSLWTYLAAGSHRGEQIAHIADYITGKREQCKAFYIQSLREPHETTLLHYSHFLTNVMFDAQTGETLRQRVAEEREIMNAQRQSRKANAANSGGAGTSQKNAGGSFARSVAVSTGNASSRWEACKMVLRESRTLGKYGGAGAGKASHVAQGYTAVKRLLVSVYFAYLCLFLAAIAMIGLMVAHLHFLRWSVERVKVAGSVRLSILLASLIVNEMAHAAQLPFPDAEKLLFLQFCVQNLQAAGANILDGHRRLMLGDLVTRDAAVSAWERDARIEVIVPGTMSVEGNYSRVLKSMFNLGSELGNMFVDIAANYQAALPQIAYVAANVQEGSFSRAFNTSVTNAMSEQQTVIRNLVWVFVAVAAFVLLMLVALYMLFIVYINRVEETKVAVVNLFTLIPKSYVEMFCRSSHAKILEFDEFEAHPEKILAAPLWEKKEQTTTHGPPLLAPPSPPALGTDRTDMSQPNNNNNNNNGSNQVRLLGQKPNEVNASSTGLLTTTVAGGGKSSPTLLGASVNIDGETSRTAREEGTIDAMLRQQQEDKETTNKALMSRERWFHTAEKVIQQRTRQLRKRELMFTTRKFSSTIWTAVRNVLTRETVQIWVMVFVVAVFLILTALSAQSYNLADEVRAVDEDMTSLRRSANNYTEYLLYLGQLTQMYIINGDTIALYEYHDFLLENNYDELFNRVILYTPNQATVQAAVNARIALNSALLCQRIALWLASYSYNVADSERALLGQIFAMDQTYNYTAMAPLLAAMMAPYDPTVPDLVPTDNVNDAALPADTKRLVARNTVFADYYYHYYDVMKGYVDQMVNSYPDTVLKLRSRLALYRLIVTILLACALAAMVLLVCMVVLSGGRQVLVLSGLTVSILLAIAALVLTRGNIDNDGLAKTVTMCYANLVSAYGNFSATLRLNRMNVMRLMAYGDPRVLAEWERTSSMATYKNILSDAFNAYLVAMPQKDSSQLSYYMNDVFSNLHHILYFTDIAMLLTTVARGFPMSPQLIAFTYDRRLEYDYLKEYFFFGNSSFTYFNRDTDLAGTPDTMVLLSTALSAVCGGRYETVSRSFRTGVTKTLDLIDSQIGERWNNVQNTIQLYTTATLYLCVVAMVVMLLTCVWSLYRTMSESQRKKLSYGAEGGGGTSAHDGGRDKAEGGSRGSNSNSRNSGGGSRGRHGGSAADAAAAAAARTHKRNNHRREMFWLALTFFFIMALFGALLIIALYNTFSPRSSTLLGTLMTQNGAVLDTIGAVQRVWLNSPQLQEISPYIDQLAYMFSTMLRVHELLYLGSTDQTFGGMIAMTQDHDPYLFGSNAFRRYEYTAACHNDEIAPGYAVLEYTSLMNATSDNILRLFSYGMENVAWQLSSLYLLVFESATTAAAQAYHRPFLIVIKQLNSALQLSSDMLLTTIDSEIVMITVVYMVLAGLLVVLLIALLVAVYIPLLRHLINQSEGARLLLQMIPEKIRREVPAIHEFFQTGSVNTDVELINNACRETQSACLVVVSKDDVILQITAEGARRFRRTEKEVLGKPIELLLAEDRGEVMVDFRRQYGVSRLSLFIGKKVRTRGRCSDGSTFPVQVTVREVCLSGRGATADMSRCYICQFVNISIDAELESARAFQAKVFGGSRRPQLIVDKRGVIRLVNQAAVKLFGYTDNELLGYNINSYVAANGLYEKDNFFSEYVARLEQRMQQQQQQQQQHASGTHGITASGHHMHPFNSHAQSIYHAHGMESHRALSSTTLGTTVRRGVQARKRDGVLTELDIMIGVIPDVDGNAPLLMLHLTDLAAGYKTIQTDSISRLMLEKSPVPVLELNTAGRVNYFSPAAERSWGYTAEQVAGWRLQSLLYGSDATRYRFDYQPSSDLLHFLDATRMLECRRADGALFTAEVLMHMVRRASTVSIIAYFKDLTQEATAAQRNIMSQWAFNSAFIPIVVTDGNGTVHSVNPAAERYFGFSAEEFAGQNITSVMIDSVAERPHYYREHYTMVVANTSLTPSQASLELDRSNTHLAPHRSPRTLGISLQNSITSLSTSNNNNNANYNSTSNNVLRQEYVKRADGHFSSVEIRVQALAVPDARMAQGIRHLYVNYIRDVNAQYEMQRMNDMQEEITKHCPTPMLALSADGVVLSCNLAAGQLLGYHAEHVVGMALDELIPALSHEAGAHGHGEGDEVLRGWMSGGVRHLSVRHRDGHAVPVELRLREVTKGTVETLFVATLVDISAQAQLENACNTEQAYTNMYPLSLIVANASGHVHFFSQEALRLFGLRSATDVIGSHLNLFLVESAATNELLGQLQLQQSASTATLDTSLSLSLSTTQNTAVAQVYTLPCIREDKVSFRARVTVKRLLEAGGQTSLAALPGNSEYAERSATGPSPAAAATMSGEALYLLFVEDLTQPDILHQSCLLRTTLLTQLDFLAVLEVTTTGRVASVNETFVRLFRLGGAAEIVGRDLGLVVRKPEHRALCEQKLRQCATGMMDGDGGRQARWTVEAVRQDNSRLSVELTVLPPSAQDAEDRLCVLLRPMAELVDARDRATALRELIATAPVPVLLLRAAHPAKVIGGVHMPEGELVVEAFNAAAERVLQYTADEVVGQKVNDLLVIPPAATPRATSTTNTTTTNAASASSSSEGQDGAGGEASPTLLQLYNEALAMLAASSPTTPDESSGAHVATEPNGLMLLLSVRTKDGRLCPMRLSVLDISLAEEMGEGVMQGASGGGGRTTRLLVIAEEAAARLRRELSYRMSAALMEVCPLGLICLAADYTIQLFSPQAERLFGFAESEVIGRPVQQLLFRTDAHTGGGSRNGDEEEEGGEESGQTLLLPLMIRAMTPVRYLGQRKNAETFAVEVRLLQEAVRPYGNGSASSDSRGAMYTLMVRDTSRDVADTTTGDLSVVTLQSLGLPFLVLTHVGVLELVNHELAAMLGYSPQELIGRNLKTLMPSAMTERLAQYLTQLVAVPPSSASPQTTAPPPPCYLMLRHRNGEELAVVLTLHCHTSHVLQKISLYGFVRDVGDTLEVRSEAIVQEALASAQGSTLLLVSAQGIIDYASPMARRLLGYDTALPVAHNEDGNPLAAPHEGATAAAVLSLLGQPLHLVLPNCGTTEDLLRVTAQSTAHAAVSEEPTERGNAAHAPVRVSAVRADQTVVECDLRVVEVYDEVGERCYGCVLRNSAVASADVRQEGAVLRRVVEGLSLVGVLLLRRPPMGADGADSATSYVSEACNEMVISRVNEYALRLLERDDHRTTSAEELIDRSLQDALPELLPAVRVLYERQRALQVSEANAANTNQGATSMAQRKVMLYRKGHAASVVGVSLDEYIAPCGESRWLLLLSDETVLTELEAEVRASYAILEALPMATLLVDDKGTILHVSEAMRALAQRGAAAAVGGAVGQNMSALFHVEESPYAAQNGENTEGSLREEATLRLVPFDLHRHLRQGVYRVVVEDGQRRAVLRIDELQGRVIGSTYLCILSEPVMV